MARWSRYLIGFGIVLFLLTVIPTQLRRLLRPILSPLGPIISLWWLFVLAGVGFIALRRWNVETPITTGGPSIERHDILESTNWLRLNRYTFRRSIAYALLVAPIPPFLLAVVLQRFDAALILALISVAATLWLFSLSRVEDITDDFTQRVQIRVPDLFSLHSFHLHLRQTAEDIGYVTSNETSPERGGARSNHNSDVFLAEGGFTARRQSIPPSKSLLSDSTELFGNSALTVLTLGVFLMLSGITLFWVNPAITGDISDFVPPSGAILLLAGILVTGYDYYSRKSQWRELYVVEEGTVYSPQIEVSDTDETSEEPEHSESEGISLDAGSDAGVANISLETGREAEVTTSQTSGVITVTVGARSSHTVDSTEIEHDFTALREAVTEAAEEHALSISDILSEEEE